MRISMLIYPDFTPLDLFGPLQIWATFPNAEIEIVAKDATLTTTDTPAQLLPTHTYDSAHRQPNILFVPGGTAGTAAIAQDSETLEYLADRGARADWVTSVCTGSLVLGAAGLLKGFRATTHWAAMDLLESFGAQPVKERWVIDRNRATGSGVTAGIDFGLALMAELAGEEAARQAQLAVEYDPQPPFRSGHPDVADAATTDAVLNGFAQDAAALADASAPD